MQNFVAAVSKHTAAENAERFFCRIPIPFNMNLAVDVRRTLCVLCVKNTAVIQDCKRKTLAIKRSFAPFMASVFCSACGRACFMV